MTILIEPHYLPSLEFFCAILPFENVILEGHENFAKQTCRNRCYVNTSHGVKLLSVPLMGRHGKNLTKDVRIDRGKQWRNNHWRTIESAYRKSPFFDYYCDDLKNIIFQGHEYLIDLNFNLLSFCLRHIGLQKNVSVSVSYEKQPKKNVTDLRSALVDKKPFLLRDFYKPCSYYQIFGSEFAPNLTLIDLLFCEGPRTLHLLKESSKK